MQLKQKIISFAFLGLILLLIGCQAEEDMSYYETRQINTDINLKKIAFSKLKTNKPALQVIEATKLRTNRTLNQRGIVLKEDYGVFIDTTQIYMIEKDNVHSITFQIVSDDESESKIENLVLLSTANGSYKAYITEYILTSQDMLRLANREFINKTPSKVTEIGKYDQVAMAMPASVEDCISMFNYSIDYCTNYNGQEVVRSGGINDDCVGGYHTRTFTLLTINIDCMANGNGGGSYAGPWNAFLPPGNPANPGVNPGAVNVPTPSNPSSPPPPTLINENGVPMLTTPILGLNLVKDFVISNLNIDQKNWWNDPANEELVSKIKKYINNFGNEEFALEMILALMDGREVNVDELYVGVSTPDDDYVYSGEKEFIPSSFILENGDNIDVTFGTTIDGQNANKKVAVELINGLKFALNEANNNLSPSEKITSISIMATTNGIHTGPNHYTGTAFDINRINGVKMITSGVTNQIIELQTGFDEFPYIRENFGPYFKHKYTVETNTWNYNHNVPGHGDHIHISVRKY